MQVNFDLSVTVLTASLKDLESKLSSLEEDKVNVNCELPVANSDMYMSHMLLPFSCHLFHLKPSCQVFYLLFALPESHFILDLKKDVDEILEFLAERPVQIRTNLIN